ncbi:MAG: tetratricopeptide repeat protein [Candidatus Eisenbacteria bacterium]|uniref:Tetratricopeptide repeat protein n=1 Tax=Eiseniibacteriota bacterium TaxID=2212470 RepID=A0A9D6QJC1_UNCEI|nr:tetratricopeptide repeat protein [Candidatus Eisenbacteria bacterium]
MPLTTQHSTRIEQPGAEIMVPLQRFWERQGKIAIGVLGVVAVLIAAGIMILRQQAKAEEAAAGKLAEASLFYWQGDFQRSLQVARETAQQYGSTPSGIDAHRQAGDAAFFAGDFKTAIAEYRRYLDRNKQGMLADAAGRSLAYALESAHEFADAEKQYLALVGHFDRSSSAEFLLAAARCERGQNQPARAIPHLQRLIDEFGDTDYAQPARIQLAELQAAGTGAAH